MSRPVYHSTVAARRGAYAMWYKAYIKGFIYPQNLPKFYLTADAEYVANVVSVSIKISIKAVVNVHQCSLLHGYATPA